MTRRRLNSGSSSTGVAVDPQSKIHGQLQKTTGKGSLRIGSPAKARATCKFFLRGTCKFGSTCELSHDGIIDATQYHMQQQQHQQQQQMLSVSADSKFQSLPVPIHQKSVPDIFMWSGSNDENAFISSNFLFYSPSVQLNDSTSSTEKFHNQSGSPADGYSFGLRNASLTDIGPMIAGGSLSKSMSFGSFGAKNMDTAATRSATPDPFSPFPEDYSPVFEEETHFMMEDITGATFLNQPSAPASSSLPSGEIYDLRQVQICPYGEAGICRYGAKCRYVHGLECPFCKKHCLHPYKPEEHTVHMEECRKEKELRLQRYTRSRDVECSLCKVQIVEKGKFGLMFCEHPFCLSCIRTHRANAINAGKSTKTILGCPVCSSITPFVTPSTYWIDDLEEKRAAITDFQQKISDVHCKYFNYGANRCPLGENCFYAHVAYDKLTPEEQRIAQIEFSKSQQNKNVRLGDFIAL